MSIFPTKKQQGVSLIIFAVVMVLIVTTLYVSRFEVNSSKQATKNHDTYVLAQAKEALLNFSATWGYTDNKGNMGFLPCPDDSTGSEGVSPLNCGSKNESRLGQLPWHTIRSEPLKDSSGNCLWYAVSAEYKNANASQRTDMLNEDSNGSFRVYAEDGTTLLQSGNPEDRIIAVIIDPGPPLPGQARAPKKNTICGEDFTSAAYLDNHNGISNQSVTSGTDQIDSFITITGAPVQGLNDRIITITQKEIYDRITKSRHFKTLMENTTQILANCMAANGIANSGNSGGGGSQCPGVVLCSACYSQCGSTAACNALPPGPGRGQCHKNLAQCHKSCRDNGCVNTLPPNCGTGGGNGSGGNKYLLPWAASLDLDGADYREDNSYVSKSGQYFGRYPQMDTTTDYFNNCTSLTDPGGGANPVDLTDANDQYTNLWKNWKDHFFFAVSRDFDQTQGGTPATCVNCITAPANKYAGIVIYSGSRLQNQLRYASPPEQSLPAFGDSKADIDNYLEGSNASNTGTGTDQFMLNPVNDFAYCIKEDMAVELCQ